MNLESKPIADTARGAFRWMNRGMLTLWRLGLGPWVNAWPEVGGRIMVVSHYGRKSGRLRRTPVNYYRAGDSVYCTAGFGAGSDWYRNVQANPAVEVWLPDGWWAGVVETMPDDPDRLPMMRQVMIASGFAARAIGLDPLRDSDDHLEVVTRAYPLLRIRLTSPRTGPGGPGDLSWVWPLATMALAWLWLFPPRRRR